MSAMGEVRGFIGRLYAATRGHSQVGPENTVLLQMCALLRIEEGAGAIH